MNYRPEIDGLRAVAVTLVLLFHAKVPGWEAGYIGVDIFFVISGFLIASILQRELADGTFSFWSFYKRRAARLLPALFVVLATASVLASQVLYPTALAEYGKSQIATVLYFSNIYFSNTLDYFSSSADVNLLVHTWSLSVEEQYYLVLPLLLFGVSRLAWRVRYVLVGVLLIASLALVETSGRGAGWLSSEAAFFLLPTRAFELLVGVLCAFTRHDRRDAAPLGPVWVAEFWTGSGLFAIGYYVFRYRSESSGLRVDALIPVCGAAALLLFADRSRAMRGLLTARPLIWLGLLSYSIYLWHQPVLALAREYSPFPLSSWHVWACLAVTLGLSYLSWRFVEKPLRAYGHQRAGRLMVGLVVVAAVLLAAGFAFYKKASYPADQRSRLEAIEQRVAFNYGAGKACSKHFDAETCGPKQAGVAIWGDSYGMHAYQALQAALPGVQIAQMTKGGCAPLVHHAVVPDATGGGASFARECIAFHQAAFRWLLDSPSVQYVFVASPWTPFSPREASLVMDDQGRQSQDRAQLVADVLDAARQLRQQGKKVIVVGATPSSGRDNGQCLKAAIRTGKPLTICDFSRADSELVHRRSANEVVELLGQALPVLPLKDFVCEGEICRASKSVDLFIYGAGGHLSQEGSAYLGRLPAFRAALQQMGLGPEQISALAGASVDGSLSGAASLTNLP